MRSYRVFMKVPLVVMAVIILQISTAHADIHLVWDEGPFQVFHRTLKSAIDDASSGDTIIVKTGNYVVDGVVVDKAITIIGEYRDSVFLSPMSANGLALEITNDTCVIENISIVVGSSQMTGGTKFVTAIRCNGSSPTIRHCNIYIYGEGYYEAIGISCTEEATPVVDSNNFVASPLGRAFAIKLRTSTANVYAESNYWNTQDTDSIAAMIWDYSDDASIGVVDNSPVATEAF